MKQSFKFKINIIQLTLWGIVGGRFIEPFLVPFIGGYCMNRKRQLRCSFIIIYSFLIVFAYGIFACLYNHYSLYKLIQQSIVLLILFLSYDIIFKSVKGDVDFLFDKYLNIAYYVSVLGIVQLVIYILFHFNLFSFISGIVILTRTTSVFLESGFLGQFLIPAFVAILFSSDYRRKYKLRSAVIVFCYFISFSAIAYFIAFFAILGKIYAMINSKLVKIGAIIIMLFTIALIGILLKNSYQSNSSTMLGQINMKIVESQRMLSMSNPEDFSEINMSSFALVSNLYAARNAPCRILGTGLGSHESNYENVYNGTFFNLTLNSSDGYSLFIRIFSEFGYLGLFVYLFWLYRQMNYRNIINRSVFFFLFSILLRGGNYFMYGIVFFHFLYYYTSKNSLMVVRSKWNF